jgi:hypothetical protein
VEEHRANKEESEARKDASEARVEERRANREAEVVERLHKHQEFLMMKLGETERRLRAVRERIVVLEAGN